MDDQESSIEEVFTQDPPIFMVAKGGSTPGGKPQRKKNSQKGRTPGGLEGTPANCWGTKVLEGYLGCSLP